MLLPFFEFRHLAANSPESSVVYERGESNARSNGSAITRSWQYHHRLRSAGSWRFARFRPTAHNPAFTKLG